MSFKHRQNQVFNEGISPIQENPYSASRLVIHEHDAKKAGKHWDIRLDIGNKAVSFATKKGLPTESGSTKMLYRQPDHVQSYMDWEGDIPEGEYGAGKVRKIEDVPIVMKSGQDHIHFTVSKGQYKGNYVLLKESEKEWRAIRKKDLDRYWADRPKYKEITDLPEDADVVASEKLDGAHFISTINPGGISYTSQRKGVKGDLLAREDKVPHLRDLKLPKKAHGMVFRGELWHDKGFNYASGLLNSNPEKAVERQKQIGPLRFAPFKIEKGPHNEEKLPYEEQMKIIKDISKDLPYYFEPPRQNEGSLQAFFDEIGLKKGEGMVLVDKKTGKFLKKKHRYDYDLKISGIIEGTGKYSGSMGAIELVDRNGRYVGKVGTGFSDAQRKDFFKNKDFYIGKLVKVASRYPLTGKLREPSFLGMTTDKNTADEVN